ncbi:MAG: hypothetical protein ACK58L_13905 [Planctomycetota bacterium]
MKKWKRRACLLLLVFVGSASVYGMPLGKGDGDSVCWTIVNPSGSVTIGPTADVAGNGLAGLSNYQYAVNMIRVKMIGKKTGLLLGSASGTSTNGVGGSPTWSCTVQCPAGGWPARQVGFEDRYYLDMADGSYQVKLITFL